MEPTDAQDLSVFYRTIKQHKCHFAVKSGGHVQHPGATNADGGITIDLQRINNVDIAPDKKTVNVGSGNKWARVHAALEKEGLYVLGGRVGDVGVGGVILGGGKLYANVQRAITLMRNRPQLVLVQRGICVRQCSEVSNCPAR